LGIISTGFALIYTIAMNILLLSTPKQFGGVVVGTAQVFTFTGISIGPVISGLFMQNFQTTIDNMQIELIPSSEAYNLIFLTAAIASFVFVVMAFILKKTITKKVTKI
jgi:MFS family permease